MLISIDNRSGIPIYRQILEQVRRQILTGRLTVGSQLASVRDLAARLRVNPMTVSKAYSLLELDELVERRRGIGLFVKRLPKGEKLESSIELLTDIIRDAAVSAIQLDVPLERALALFKQCHARFSAQRRPENEWERRESKRSDARAD